MTSKTNSTKRRQVCTEGSGEIRWKAPTPEREDAVKRKEGSRALVKPEGSTYARARSTHSVQYGENKVWTASCTKVVATGVRVSYESPTVLLMFIAQKFDISGLVLIYPHPWHPWALPPSPGQGPPRPARCDMRLFICTCIDPISRSRSYCIVLDLTHPYTIFPQSARMLVSKLVGTWIFVLLWGALHGPNCPESLTA